jgi:sigma-B regulation protein RsbU (phosphoserine phosphatase)
MIEQELSVAHQIQQSMLPAGLAAFAGREDLSLYAESQPAREVGGDFYDYFLLDETHAGVVIGDVSGKGVPAALFMAVSRTLLRATAKLGLTPGECLTYVNQTLAAQSFSSMFVTVFYAILNTGTGELRYSIGGHNPPYILTERGSVRAVPGNPCCVVGAVEAATYNTDSLRLEPGDCLLMYTDGVPEAMNDRQEPFSEERLEAILSARTAQPVDRLVRSILDDVRAFSGSDSLSDDTTVFAVRYSGPGMRSAPGE